jgi:hypothetical protein
VPTAALELADAARTDTGTLGQLLLGQPGRPPLIAQELAKPRRKRLEGHARIVA